MTITGEDSTNVSTIENTFTGAKILEMNGAKWTDFKDDDAALEAVRHLVKVNAQEGGHQFEEHLDTKFLQFSKYFYKVQQGKKKEMKQKEQIELGQSSDLKSLQQLQEAKSVMGQVLCLTGFDENAPMPSGVTVENIKAEALGKEVEKMKPS